MTGDTSDGTVLACIVTAAHDLRPGRNRDLTAHAIGALAIAAEILWTRLDDDGREAWLDEWGEQRGDALRATLPDAIALRKERGWE